MASAAGAVAGPLLKQLALQAGTQAISQMGSSGGGGSSSGGGGSAIFDKISNVVGSIGQSVFRGDSFKEGLGRAIASASDPSGAYSLKNKREREQEAAATKQQIQSPAPAPAPAPPPVTLPQGPQQQGIPSAIPTQQAPPPPPAMPLLPAPEGYQQREVGAETRRAEEKVTAFDSVAEMRDSDISAVPPKIYAFRTPKYLYIVRRYPMSGLRAMLVNWAQNNTQLSRDNIEEILNKYKDVVFTPEGSKLTGTDPSGATVLEAGPSVAPSKPATAKDVEVRTSGGVGDPVMTSAPDNPRLTAAPEKTAMSQLLGTSELAKMLEPSVKAATHAMAASGAIPYESQYYTGMSSLPPSQQRPGLWPRQELIERPYAPTMRTGMVQEPSGEAAAKFLRQKAMAVRWPVSYMKTGVSFDLALDRVKTSPTYRRYLMDTGRLKEGQGGVMMIASNGGQYWVPESEITVKSR